jgi:hypothetical protein
MTGRVFRALAPLALALVLSVVGMLLAGVYARAAEAPIVRKSSGVHVAFLCGLFSGNACGLTEIAAKAEARGWSASVHSHWADPVAIAAQYGKARLALVGHSAGADRILNRADLAGARVAISIDPTIANGGAPDRVPAYNFYNPSNLRLICCGGARVAGAHSNMIVRAPHVTMPRDRALQDRVIYLIEKAVR